MDGAEYNTEQHVTLEQHAEFMREIPPRETLSGRYLSSRFAQRHHDWSHATGFVEGVLAFAPDDLSLQKRIMVLGMGAGQTDLSIEKARAVLAEEPYNALALLFVSMDEFKNQNYEAAAAHIDSMPIGSLSAFIMPLLHSWAQASLGKNDTGALRDSALHIYHAILVADFLGDHAAVKALLSDSLETGDISTSDLTRIAAIYGHIGDIGKAKELYKKVLMVEPDNAEALENLTHIDSGEDIKIFDRVDSPEDGLSEAMYDMARILYSDYSDESARIFAHLSLFLNPEKMDAVMLLGRIASRNERMDDAIAFYGSVPPESPQYFDAARLAADLLEDEGRIDEALAMLNTLVDTHDDLEALVQIGDIHRRNDNFKEAIKVYNRAEKMLGGSIPADHWQIHYVRGMSYEQNGQWEKAQKDLETALKYQPDHPFVLNYLGYSWADLGVNLEKSRQMIERAVELRPEDGYITDSLGWVLYKMGRYKEAVPYLERAVELLPYDPVINDHLGDAYWKVGRRLEARFQWTRAKNHSDDEELLSTIQAKMDHGLDQPVPVTKAADAINAVHGKDEPKVMEQ